jgi:hypothetical protein
MAKKVEDINDFVTAKEAAETIGVSYMLLMARIRKNKIRVRKFGWATMIHKDEVAREAKRQRQINKTKR